MRDIHWKLAWLILGILGLIALISCAPILPANVRISPIARNNLHFLYEHMDSEFAFCVYGDYDGHEIRVTRISLPMVYLATDSYIQYEPCDGQDVLGIGHSHMDGLCNLSMIDANSLVKMRFPFGFLVCPDNKFAWFSRNRVKDAITKTAQR